MSEEKMNKQEMLTWRTRFVNGAFCFVFAALCCLVVGHFLGYREAYGINRLLLGSALICGLISGSLAIFINRNFQNFARSYAVGCGCGVLSATQALVSYQFVSGGSLGLFGLRLLVPFLSYAGTTIVVLFLFHRISYELTKLDRD